MGNPNLIETTAGYSVEVTRTSLRYVNGDHVILLDSEWLGGDDRAIATNATSMKRWEPPQDGEPIDDEERKRIIEDIELAFESEGWVLRAEWPFGERQPDGTWSWSTEGRSGGTD